MTKLERLFLPELLSAANGPDRLRMFADEVSRGALFIHPTETVYGIGGAASVHGVMEKIIAAKRRVPENPFILLAADRKFFTVPEPCFTPSAERLAAAFWPGMLTLVLPCAGVPSGIAVRVSGHPFIKALFTCINMPIFSTSANISDQPYVNDPDLIFSVFSKDVDFMIDAGILPQSQPSTVVKINEHDVVSIVREGAIPACEIAAALRPGTLSFPERTGSPAKGRAL